MKRARRKSNRVKISFAVTILVMSVATIVVYSFSFRVPQYPIPSNLPPYAGLAGKYGPADALQVTFYNYTAIRAINSSAVPNRQLLNLAHPDVVVRVASVSSRVLVSLVRNQPKINNSATAAVLSPAAFLNLSKAFSSSNLTPTQVGQFNLYNVTDSSSGRTKNEWVTLVPSDSVVLFSEGTSGAKATVAAVLQVREGQSPSILSLQNVTRMLFTVGGPTHLALSIQSFPGQVMTSDMGVVAVDATSTSAQVSDVVRFANSTYASAQTGQVRAAYRYASDFSQYEECVKAVESYPISSLQEAVGLAGG